MSGKSHCTNISPKRGRNRRPVVPKLRVLTQRHPSWGILEKSRIGFSFTDHHCLNPSPPPTNVPFTSPVTHSPTSLPPPAPHLMRSNTCRLADGPLLSAGLPAGPLDHQKGGDEREAKRESTGRERWGSGDSRRGCNGSDLST